MTVSENRKSEALSCVISSTESESEESERFHFYRFRLRPRRWWSSENEVVGVGSRSGRTNQSQGPESNIVIGLFFRFCLRLRQCSFHLIISDGVISRISVLLPSVWFSLDRTLLITTSTTTPLLMKTSLNYIIIILLNNKTHQIRISVSENSTLCYLYCHWKAPALKR